MRPLRILLEPVITPLFHAWWRIRRGATLGVRSIVLDEAGRVLLVRHTYVGGWHLPGGGVEHGETAQAAAVRELAEEGGVQATAPPRLLGLYANHAHFPNDHIAVYCVDSWRACASASEGEIAERGFFARDALPDGVTGGTRRRLHELNADAPVSASW